MPAPSGGSADLPPLLRGGALAAARALWLALVGLSLALLVRGVSAHGVQPYASYVPLASGHAQTAGTGMGTNIAEAIYGGTILGAEIAAALGFFLVAGLIFWRRSNNWVALLVALMLAAFGAALPGTIQALVTSQPIWTVPESGVEALGWWLLLIFAYVFPDGRFVPRWSAALAGLWAAWVALFFLFAGSITKGRPLVVALAFVIWVGWLGTGVLAQFYRYRYVATAAQRQQTKWIVWGFALAMLGAGAVVIPHILALAGISGRLVAYAQMVAGAPYQLVAAVGLCLAGLLIPLSIGVAILRHHLYDIDLLINRTLVYGALTATLAVIYFGVVIALQRVAAVALGTGSSTLAIVVTTLLIAALFTPLRQRIQVGIDRSFYRRKYDAARTLAAFGSTLRHAVDLEELSDQLVAIVRRTMRPEQVSLWLAPPKPVAPDGERDGAERE
jgi:hypothetical protein